MAVSQNPVTSTAVVLVVGSLHYDIMVEANALPQPDETAIGSRWYPKFGGKGGNQAVAAHSAGAIARFCGAVGDDDFGRFLRDHLRSGGVDDRNVATVNAGSGMSVAIIDRAGDYAATIVSGANLLISHAALQEPSLWQDVAILVLQNEVTEAINLEAANQARARGIPVLLNAAPYRPIPDALCNLIDVLVVNAVEAEMMGCDRINALPDASAAAQALAARFQTVIVTAGALGLAAQTAKGADFEIAAERVSVVSSHGAGDAFIGTLAHRLAQGDGLEVACRAASAAAARHVSGKAVTSPG
jgi:ribokinase